MKRILCPVLALSCLTLSVQTLYAQAISANADLNTFTLNFSQMSPHVGDDVWLAVIEAGTMTEVGRTHAIGDLSFVMEIPNILEDGKSYQVDFYADENENGHYDPPSADHAWRLQIEDSQGDETLSFSHEIAFTDIQWKHRLRLALTGMAGNSGQEMIMYVRDQGTGNYLDTVSIDAIPGDEFTLDSYVIGPGGNYMLDFYADLNDNGLYDAPPVDQAWRVLTGTTVGDLQVDFSHNQDFTDIFQATGISGEADDLGVRIYPNPASTFLHIYTDSEPGNILSLSVFSPTGAILSRTEASGQTLNLDIGYLPDGIYILRIESGSNRSITRFLKQ